MLKLKLKLRKLSVFFFLLLAGATFGLVEIFMGPEGFIPHRYCLNNDNWLIGLEVFNNAIIWIAYMVIGYGMALIAVRSKMSTSVFGIKRWLYLAFAFFILSCGFTHILKIVNLWWPVYRFASIIDTVCALSSITTAIVIQDGVEAFSKRTDREET